MGIAQNVYVCVLSWITTALRHQVFTTSVTQSPAMSDAKATELSMGLREISKCPNNSLLVLSLSQLRI